MNATTSKSKQCDFSPEQIELEKIYELLVKMLGEHNEHAERTAERIAALSDAVTGLAKRLAGGVEYSMEMTDHDKAEALTLAARRELRADDII